jgi:hypothetical protein
MEHDLTRIDDSGKIFIITQYIQGNVNNQISLMKTANDYFEIFEFIELSKDIDTLSFYASIASFLEHEYTMDSMKVIKLAKDSKLLDTVFDKVKDSDFVKNMLDEAIVIHVTEDYLTHEPTIATMH